MTTQDEIAVLHAELERARLDACQDPTNGWSTSSLPMSVCRAAEALATALDLAGPRAKLPPIAEVWP